MMASFRQIGFVPRFSPAQNSVNPSFSPLSSRAVSAAHHRIIGERPPGMKKRLWYGFAIVLLVISVILVVSQGSFTLGQYQPVDPHRTFIFWALSSLIFILMVTLGFI